MPSIPSAPIYDVAPLLPHSGHMVLIDCVKEFGDDYTVCRAPVGDKHILLQDGVLPSMAYMELMAQGIGAFAGIEALKAGEPVRLGFYWERASWICLPIPCQSVLSWKSGLMCPFRIWAVWAYLIASCDGRMRRKM